MQRDRYSYGFFQPGHDLVSDIRLQQAGHVLDADRVAAHLFQTFSQFDPRVGCVRWADRKRYSSLGVFPGPQCGAHGALQVAQVVHGVEDSEHVHAVGSRALHECFHDVVGVVPVSEDVLAAEEHLETRIRHRLANEAEPLPGILAQESNGSVEGCATPDFGGPIADPVQLFADGQHVVDSHARGKQRLIPVAQRNFGDAERFSIDQSNLPISVYSAITN